MLKQLWMDEGGAVLSTELILIMVLTVIGMIVGLTALRDAVDYQLADLAGAIANIDVSYSWEGLEYKGFTDTTGHAAVADSHYDASFSVGGVTGISLLTGLGQTAAKGVPTDSSGP